MEWESKDDGPSMKRLLQREENRELYISRSFTPRVELPDRRTPIGHISNNPASAKLEIEYQRTENRRLKKQLVRMVMDREMGGKRVLVSWKEGIKINEAVNTMTDTIVDELEKSGEPEACEL